jgi:Ala-tRNA(Pro) deacylase
MTILSHWFEYLNRHHVRFSHSVHGRAETAIQTADAERMPAHDFAKVVAYFAETGFGLAVLPADDFVDFVELGRLLGADYIRLATEAELRELFPDCELGAVPPFGEYYGLPVLLDTQIAEKPFMAFALGTHNDVIRIGTPDFKRLTRPLVGAISLQEMLTV